MYLLPFWWLFSDCFVVLFYKIVLQNSFVVLFVLPLCSLPLWFDTIFSVMFGFLSLFCMCIYYGFPPHFLGRTSATLIILSFVGAYLGCGCCLYHVSAPFPFLVEVPFLYLQQWKIFSASLQVILIDSCSKNSHNLGVPVGGGEFRVFPLCYIGLYGL